MKTSREVSELAKNVYKKTLDWGHKVGLSKNESKTEIQEKLGKLFKQHGYVDSSFFIGFAEIITGEDLSFLQTKGKKIKFVYGIVVVPTDNTNSHSYDIGKPIFCSESSESYFIDHKGNQGNHMDCNVYSFRLPEIEEVEKFLKSLKKYSPQTYQSIRGKNEYV